MASRDVSPDLKSAALADFAGVTGASNKEATFYLEAAGWDVTAAVDAYYQAMGDEVKAAATSRTPAVSAPPAPIPTATRIATLASTSQQDRVPAAAANTYYAGGDRSGIAIEGPPPPRSHNGIVDEILRQAAGPAAAKGPSSGRGAAPGDDIGHDLADDDHEGDKGGYNSESFGRQGGASSSVSPQARERTQFVGRGSSLLRSDAAPSSPSSSVAPPNNSAGSSESTQPEFRGSMTFWKNGFTVGENNDFFPFSNPDSMRILQGIRSGRALTRIFGVPHNVPVSVDVQNRGDEDFVPPVQPFASTGHSLAAAPQAGSSQVTTQSSLTSSGVSPSALQINSSAPTTRLQFREASGNRTVLTLNRTHSVRDLYAHILHSGLETRPFVLTNPMSQQAYRDLDKTIEEAGLINSVIVASFK